MTTMMPGVAGNHFIEIDERDEPTARGHEMETASPLETLTWAVERYGHHLTFATGLGPEGCVLIDLIGRHKLPIDVFTLDTGFLFPETHELWNQLESRYDVTIRGVRPTLSVDEQTTVHGSQLWAREPDRCCQIRKVVPLQAELAGVDAWITAIRREQTPERARAHVVEWDKKFAIAKINPLVRWTKQDVWSHLATHDVPHNRLHHQGFPSLGCTHCTSAVQDGESDRAGRWRGMVKTECGIHGSAVADPQLSRDTS